MKKREAAIIAVLIGLIGVITVLGGILLMTKYTQDTQDIQDIQEFYSPLSCKQDFFVYDEYGKPISGATVLIRGEDKEDYTDSDGECSIAGLERGRYYWIDVGALGYYPNSLYKQVGVDYPLAVKMYKLAPLCLPLSPKTVEFWYEAEINRTSLLESKPGESEDGLAGGNISLLLEGEAEKYNLTVIRCDEVSSPQKKWTRIEGRTTSEVFLPPKLLWTAEKLKQVEGVEEVRLSFYYANCDHLKEISETNVSCPFAGLEEWRIIISPATAIPAGEYAIGGEKLWVIGRYGNESSNFIYVEPVITGEEGRLKYADENLDLERIEKLPFVERITNCGFITQV